MPLLPRLAVVLAVSSPLAVAQTVLTVGPGEAYAEISRAVDDAQDGDLIRVRPGTYEHFAIFGKSVSVMATEPGVRVLGQVRVQHLTPDDAVVLSGLEIESPGDHGLTIAYCDGSVRVQDCRAEGGNYAEGTSAIDHASTGEIFIGGRVIQSDDVSLTRCEFLPGTSPPFYYPDLELLLLQPPAGLVVADSTVALESCTVRGGYGGGSELSGNSGSAGMELVDSFASLRASEALGGDGGWVDGFGFSCGFPGDGGPGVHAVRSTLVLMDSNLVGGLGGFDVHIGTCPDGSDGAPYWAIQSTVNSFPGTAPRIHAPTLVSEGDTVPFTFEGPVGTRVDILVSLNDGFVHLPALRGNLLVAGPFLRHRFIAGTVPGSGSLTWTLGAPGVPSGTWSGIRFQSGHYDPGTGAVVLGPVHVLGILDGVF